MRQRPKVTLLAGPNGAGKSTLLGRLVLPDTELVLADPLADVYRKDGMPLTEANFRAGRDVINRLNELEKHPASFLHETNLGARCWMRRLIRLENAGYESEVVFVGLRHQDLAVERVAARVRNGGHPVDEQNIRDRWGAGLRYFFGFYQEHAESWNLFDNEDEVILVATGGRSRESEYRREDIWSEYLNLVAQIESDATKATSA